MWSLFKWGAFRYVKPRDLLWLPEREREGPWGRGEHRLDDNTLAVHMPYTSCALVLAVHRGHTLDVH